MQFSEKYFHTASLIDLAYNGNFSDARDVLDEDGVQAYVTHDRTLVIPGTNEKSDWLQFNFRTGKGATRVWHKGFLEHAKKVYEFAKDADIKLITGHSLGAASAQIVGYSLKVDTIAFASPKPLHRERLNTVHAPNVKNVCREDDIVCSLPPHRFRHVGKTTWLAPKKHHWGMDHSIEHYVDAMREANEEGT